MIFKQYRLIISLFFVQGAFAVIETPYMESLESLLGRFSRPITMLEIGLQSCDYSMVVSSHQVISACLLTKPRQDRYAAEIEKKEKAHMMLLNPSMLTLTDLETLGRCEHFDVVLVHDCLGFFKESFMRVIETLKGLGEHVLIDIDWGYMPDLVRLKDSSLKIISRSKKGQLYLYQSPKEGLEIARFTQGYKPKGHGFEYQIMSDYTQKLFFKSSLDKPIPYVPGINLMTFVLLRGMYPNDILITQQIKNLKNNIEYHNDLMIGNMIIQGLGLVAIDFKDARRSAHMATCIDRALEVFNGDKSRLKNPMGRIQDYYDKNKSKS